MRTLHVAMLCATTLGASALVGAAGIDQSPLNDLEALNSMAPPLMGSGVAEIKLTNVATSQSSQMDPLSVYCLTCDSTAGDAHYVFGDGSGPTAVAGTGRLLRDGGEKCFRSGAAGDSDYIAVISAASGAGNCFLNKSE